MVALHMDWSPMPWSAFEYGTSPPAAWLAEMERVSAVKAQLGLPVYLALTPIAGPRDAVKEQASGSGTVLLPPAEETG